MNKYKRAIRDYKMLYGQGSSKKKAAAKSAAKGATKNEAAKTFDNANAIPDVKSINDHATFIPTKRCSLDEVDAAFSNDMDLDLDLINVNLEGKESPEMVDLEDDAIVDLWKRHFNQHQPPMRNLWPTQSQGWAPSMTAPVVSLSSFHGGLPNPPRVTSMQNESFVSQGPNFQATNLRMTLLDQQIRMQSNLIAAIHSTAARQITDGAQKNNEQT